MSLASIFPENSLYWFPNTSFGLANVKFSNFFTSSMLSLYAFGSIGLPVESKPNKEFLFGGKNGFVNNLPGWGGSWSFQYL